MPSRIILACIFLSAAQEAVAGPWLREKGTSFTAVSVSTNYHLETGNQTYLEYGLTEKTTLVADVGMARFHTAPNTGYATLSFRRALGRADATSKWAYEVGIGAGWIGTETLPHIRTALSWGRGLTWGEATGWTTVEAAVVWDVTHDLHVVKLDSTLGVDLTDATKGMLQFYTAHAAGNTIATLAPSLVYKPKNTKFSIQMGAESEVGNWENSVLKIGIWRDF